jgi:glycine oxidase
MSDGERADVVVVGGGIVGACVAYVLAGEGLDVCILERDSIGSGATGHGHGVISLVGLDFRPGAHFQLGAASAAIYAEFAAALLEDSGVDTLYHELPSLSLAILPEEQAIFRECMRREDVRHAIDMRWVGIDEIRALEPRITEEAIGAVLYRHGQVDGYRVALATTAAVERRGGRVVRGEADGVVQASGRVTGVTYGGGTIACEHLVVAAGAWAGATASWLGCPVPVRPLHGEVLHVNLPGTPIPVFILTGRHGPILRRKDGLLMVGSIGGVTMSGIDVLARHVFDPADTSPPVFDGQPREESRDLMIERAVRVMPAIADAELVTHLAGVRPLSADRMPLIGAVPGLDGAYLATGHGTKGIHLAPITARMIADLIVGGSSAGDVPRAEFLPARFVPDPA